MSPPGRPKGETRSAQRAGDPMPPPGRPKGETRSAQRAGDPMPPPGRPKGETRSAQRERRLVRLFAAPTRDRLAAAHAEPGAARLADAEIERCLAALAGWARVDDRIEKTFLFDDFHRTMAFVNALAFIAHRENHHPDLAVHYGRCIVALSTHDAGGITGNDCIVAARIERLLA
jgi:4a-hydroxytetrahydrobiopterin dehydratase